MGGDARVAAGFVRHGTKLLRSAAQGQPLLLGRPKLLLMPVKVTAPQRTTSCVSPDRSHGVMRAEHMQHAAQLAWLAHARATHLTTSCWRRSPAHLFRVGRHPAARNSAKSVN